MNSLNTLKVTVAFLAGLVIALGGALIYVRSSEPSSHVQTGQPVQQAAVQPQPTPVQTPNSPAPTEAAPEPVQPAPVQTPAPERKPAHKELAQTKKHKVHRAVTTEDASNENVAAAAPQPPAQDPVQTAQAAPASVPPAHNRQPEPQGQSMPSTPPPPPQPQAVTLKPGTTLAVRLGEDLSTDRNFTGDTFRATLASPIVRDGFIIADRGSQVLGRIVNSEKAGRVQGVADLTLALTAINTTDRQQIAIQTNTTDIKGPTSKKRDAAEIAGGSALGAIIGAIAGGGKGAAIGAGAGGGAGTVGALSTRGKAAVVRAETPLTFQLNSPVTITEKMNQ